MKYITPSADIPREPLPEDEQQALRYRREFELSWELSVINEYVMGASPDVSMIPKWSIKEWIRRTYGVRTEYRGPAHGMLIRVVPPEGVNSDRLRRLFQKFSWENADEKYELVREQWALEQEEKLHGGAA